jgi:hypothetical protein
MALALSVTTAIDKDAKSRTDGGDQNCAYAFGGPVQNHSNAPS